jgi:Ni,Fe-hydrogenase maturation factor
MQRLIIGYGNTLRGQDAFGVDAIAILGKKTLKNTTLLSAFQLTPEMALTMLNYSHIVFIDTAFSHCYEYALACSLENSNGMNLSHHISAFHLIDMVNTLYKHHPSFEIFSMLGNDFETIQDRVSYEQALLKTTEFLQLFA